MSGPPTLDEQITAVAECIARDRQVLQLAGAVGLAAQARDVGADYARRIGRLEAAIASLRRLKATVPPRGAVA